MKNSILVILILMAVYAQAADSVICKINTVSTFFTVDAMGAIYYINEKEEIVKSNFNDSVTITYSNLNLGRPTFIDVSNPLKILVFYPDRQSIIILDNRLSELSMLQLTGTANTNNYQPTAICKLVGTDHIWMYDELSRKLIRLDEAGKVIAESEVFDQLFDFSLNLQKIFSANDKVYISANGEGILVFDAYANYIQTIPFLFPAEQVTDNYIIALTASAVKWYALKTGEVFSRDLPLNDVTQLYLFGTSLFLRNNNGICVTQ
ncbi:MAG: hypothetical protein IPO24_00165 [Bacteroidetes bacterium]|nr:hypothetical protein [Bacteroidota bacterium]